ncbi:aldo/keto reductase [Micromonospora sp. HK10]|uniref:aldo/keto reductase n=1 Tax=Micromonospora sp. HK10 TaxID=1538294 RepID=UPI00062732C2|nr:aldo/keto reductase [Micromonospora sp. HK10]KKK01324.1 aldo/keto reductase [Micromonospora sp. HK10]
MRSTTLGESGPAVSAIGLGCMGMSALYGPRPDDEQSLSTIHRALDLGINLIDTSASYGDGHNEQLIAKAIRGRRSEVFLCTKFGIRRDGGPMRVDSSPEWARKSCDESLERLRVDHIDLFYLHRRNPDVPVEDTIGAMAELVAAGKVRHLGVSEVSPQTLRRAHDVHPLAALQTEYSLFSREVEAEILPTCRELGITLVAYSPLGRALLSGQITADTAFGAEDLRSGNPRFVEANRAANLALVDRLRALADEMGVVPAQLALAWLLAQGTVPIPGTTRIRHLEQNVASTAVTLTPEQLRRITDLIPAEAVQGERLAASAARWVGK